MTTSIVDRTWTEDAAGGHLETHVGEFAVEVVHRNGSEHVVVGGQLTGATAPLLLGVLDSVYARQPRRLEIDLSGLTHLAAHPMITLASHHRSAARHADLVFLDPSPIARRALTLTGLDQMVEDSASPGPPPTAPDRRPMTAAPGRRRRRRQ